MDYLVVASWSCSDCVLVIRKWGKRCINQNDEARWAMKGVFDTAERVIVRLQLAILKKLAFSLSQPRLRRRATSVQKEQRVIFLASPIIDFALMSNAHRQHSSAASSRLSYVTRLLQEVTDCAELVNSTARAHERTFFYFIIVIIDNLRRPSPVLYSERVE